MSIKYCKTCGTTVSNSDEFCPECGCRCNYISKSRSKSIFKSCIIPFAFAIWYIITNVFIAPNYNGIYLVCFSALISIGLDILSFFKKKFNNKNILSIVISISAVAIVLLFNHCNFLTFKIPNSKFQKLFSISASGFIDTKGSGTVLDGKFAFAKQTKDGTVIIKMSNEQKDEFLAQCATEISKSRNDDIYISTSFNEIQVKLYQENLITDTMSAVTTIHYCYLYQLFNNPKNNADNISVNYILLDGSTGKELYSSKVFIDDNPKKFHITKDELSSKWDDR